MNILIPHSWLLEHLETDVSPQELQRLVSLSGPSVERIYEREGEAVYDIEVTTNRVDSMSVRGIAREAAVILAYDGRQAKLKPLQLSKVVQNGPKLPLPKIHDPHHLSKRIACVVLTNFKRTPTPEWMAQRLRQIDQNVHDSVIDITNYITHELGHPCHAFDYDKIMELGGEIIISEAKEGEKFTTLDGETYETVGGEIVYKNPAGEIIDLPAIKGTANTSINGNTKNILLWAENIDAQKVRFASMTHAIRTVAAQLNEKNVDPELMTPILDRGVELYASLCQAQVASSVLDLYPAKQASQPVVVTLETILNYLGVSLSSDAIITILENLGCSVELTKETFTIMPPTFRPDLVIPADIVEEVARIYGYHNLPSTLMATAIPLEKPENTDFVTENRIKYFLADIGWQEVYTYSLVSEQLALESGYDLSEHLKLQNPLTDDRVYLRRTLLPSLAEVLSQNSLTPELSVFEIANLYQPQKTEALPEETLHLGLVSSRDYRRVKGDLEALLLQFFISELVLEPLDQPSPQFSQEADMKVLNEEGKLVRIGKIGILKSGLVGAGLAMASVLKVIKKHPKYQSIPKTSPLFEDLTFTLPEATAVGTLVRELKALDPLINRVQLGDVYQRNFTFKLTYLDSGNNLTSELIIPIRKKILHFITQNYQGTLVGQIE